MILARGQAAPLRFLVAVVLLWVAVRGAFVMGWQPFAPERQRLGPPPGWLMMDWPAGAPAPLVAVRDATARAVRRLVPASPSPSPQRATPVQDRSEHAPEGPIREGIAMGANTLALLAVAAFRPYGERSYAEPTGVSNAVPLVGAAATDAATAPSRWSGSAWAFVRGGGRAAPLSPDGQIGGGQAGARVLYRLDDAGRLAAAARLSRTIGGPNQSEAALGIDWRPIAALPLHLAIERRIAIDHGGRNAWAVGAAGGAYDVALAPGWRLDGYAEAGVVGTRRRDLYGDGAVRAGRAVDLGDGKSLTLGPGLWGAAQPHATRLDAGPSAVLRVPVAKRTVAAALDYRARVAGGARPHSGVAFTLGVDF